MTRARTLVRALVAAGVLNWFYAPGSRNAPLGYALAEWAELMGNPGKPGVPGAREVARSRGAVPDSPRELAAGGRINLNVRIDERDAAFMALGSSKLSGAPAAVVMTSGTAVGNALPAVMEAYHSQTPLLVISADRPAELRGSGANQTTIQPGIFGGFVRFEADLQPGDSLESLELSARSAVAACCGCSGVHEEPTGVGDQNTVNPPSVLDSLAQLEGSTDNHSDTWAFQVPGPAHLNIAFTEPLVPPEVQERFDSQTYKEISTNSQGGVSPKTANRGRFLGARAQRSFGDGGKSLPPFNRLHTEIAVPSGLHPCTATRSGCADMRLRRAAQPTTSGDVLIVGDLPREDFPGADALWRAVAAGGVPVFAEPTTRWRHHPNAVLAYSHLAGRPGWAAAIRRILVVGRPTLSRPITRLLQEARAEFLDVPGLAVNLDGGEHRRWTDAAALAASLEKNPGGGSRQRRETEVAPGAAGAALNENNGETRITAKVADTNRWLELIRRIDSGQDVNLDSEAEQRAARAVSWLEQWQLVGESVAGELCAEWGIYQVASEIWICPEASADLFLGASSTIRAFDAVAGLGVDLVSLGSLEDSGNSDIPGNLVPISDQGSNDISSERDLRGRRGGNPGLGAGEGVSPHEPARDVESVRRWAASDARFGEGAVVEERGTSGLAPHEPGKRRRVYANRGLAGIDGAIACAWGAALSVGDGQTETIGETSIMSDGRRAVFGERGEASGTARGRAMRLVLGDVSFFHDLGALVRGRLEAAPNLQVIVLDNGGGQIFAGLEHGCAPEDVLDRLFLTPQLGDPVALARAAGWEAETVRDLAGLRAALACPIAGLSLLRVVVTDT